jgi:hypothetical protein
VTKQNSVGENSQSNIGNIFIDNLTSNKPVEYNNIKDYDEDNEEDLVS